MKKAVVLVVGTCGVMFAPVGLAADDLELHCPGSGVATDIQNNTVVGRDSDHKRSTAIVQTHNKRPFEGAVDIKLEMGSAKIRIPPGMYPSVYISDKTKWLDVTKIDTNEREIKGEFKITLLTQPDFRIDRVTGEISVSDSSIEFTGACEKVDSEAPTKF